MNTYTRVKLAEESGELVQATCKHILHNDKTSKLAMINEMADVQAFILLSLKHMSSMDKKTFRNATARRIEHEKRKGKA